MSTLLVALLAVAFADEPPPNTDIFVVDLDPTTLRVGVPHNVTPRMGYDNQPAFLLDDTGLLYVAAEGAGPTDVFRFDFATGATTSLTSTPEAEFSPTPIPEGFSTVRVGSPTGDTEAYTESQGLWRYGDADKTPLFPSIRRVGYHPWLDSGHVAGDIKRIAVSHDGRRLAFVVQPRVPVPGLPHTTPEETP